METRGQPLGNTTKHPFTFWAQTIGGILLANEFRDFLANYAERRTVDDPVRSALGLLGATMPDKWQSASEWEPAVRQLGITNRLIPKDQRESPESRARHLGVVFSAHRDETFVAETDAELMTVRLQKRRRRFDGGPPKTKYRFEIISRKRLPDEEENGNGGI